MKGVKSMGIPSLVPPVEWETNAPSLNSHAGAPRNPSLHMSIERAEADRPSSPRLPQGSEEEHRKQLVCLGEKVGQLAHDIRNPLSSIEWFATLLGRDHHSQEERQDLADHCIQAVRSLDHLVANMLVFSTPLHSQREPVDLLALLDDVELLAMYPLRKKQLTIHRRLDAKLSAIKGHESLLKQALLNLLINAIHASDPDNPIEIHCCHTTRPVGGPGSPHLEDGLVLRIRDHGCGMSEEELSNMFRPFYSRRKGGTGLGLSIVKQIIHIHHGLIDITSQQGKGTTVELFFPQ
jgi:signal transduction histidine kinase